MEHPTLPEFTVCGEAFDPTEDGWPPRISGSISNVDCQECLRVIRAFKAIRLPATP
jgi:hypothetical protein